MSDNKQVSGSMLAYAIDTMLGLIDDKANASELANKQDKLTFDPTPTTGSNNPVTSSGINAALNVKANVSDLEAIQADVNNKAQVQIITWENDD